MVSSLRHACSAQNDAPGGGGGVQPGGRMLVVRVGHTAAVGVGWQEDGVTKA